jgi:hypothetical protein
MSAPTIPTVEIAPGVTIDATMSPLERHNAVAKSLGEPEVARPAPPIFGPTGHPPMPLEGGEVVVDENAISKLNSVWSAMSPEQRDATRAQYTEELAEFYSGRTLAEGRGNFLARTGGNAKHE